MVNCHKALLSLIVLALCGPVVQAQLPFTEKPAADKSAAEKSAAPKADPKAVASMVPLEYIPERVRDHVRNCLDKPTLFTPGEAETFQCQPAMYYWFLDHPDRAVVAWQRLGAAVMPISDRGNGKFGWTDELGSDVVWETVYRSPSVRVWYAEGKIKLGKLLPFVPVKGVVVLRHGELHNAKGQTFMGQQGHLYITADNQAMAVAAKIFGNAAPKLAEQSMSQLQMFFGGLAWYMDRHPDRVEGLLVDTPALRPTGN